MRGNPDSHPRGKRDRPRNCTCRWRFSGRSATGACSRKRLRRRNKARRERRGLTTERGREDGGEDGGSRENNSRLYRRAAAAGLCGNKALDVFFFSVGAVAPPLCLALSVRSLSRGAPSLFTAFPSRCVASAPLSVTSSLSRPFLLRSPGDREISFLFRLVLLSKAPNTSAGEKQFRTDKEETPLLLTREKKKKVQEGVRTCTESSALAGPPKTSGLGEGGLPRG